MKKIKARVITIYCNEQSEDAADRAVKSAKGIGGIDDAEKVYGYTPADHPLEIARNLGIDVNKFREKYSDWQACVAAFLSHRKVWQQCARDDCLYVVLEHDAVFVSALNLGDFKSGCMNIAKPSYGTFETPQRIGLNIFQSKKGGYFGGAHGYVIDPYTAQHLIDMAPQYGKPTDLYLNRFDFPFITEYYPWCVEARDSFTTIQKKTGCIAKHNWGDDYEILTNGN